MEYTEQKHIQNIVESTVIRTLEKCGLLKLTLTRAEVERNYSRATFEKSKQYVRWQKKGKTVTCIREDFENYLHKFDIELKIIKQ